MFAMDKFGRIHENALIALERLEDRMRKRFIQSREVSNMILMGKDEWFLKEEKEILLSLEICITNLIKALPINPHASQAAIVQEWLNVATCLRKKFALESRQTIALNISFPDNSILETSLTLGIASLASRSETNLRRFKM